MWTWLPLAAFLLDLAFKDPERWPHPVRWIGSVLQRLELTARTQRRLTLRQAGVAAVIALIVLVGLCTLLVTSLPVLGLLAGIYLAYAGLSLAGLLQAAREIADLADSGSVPLARTKLGCLVSRDTSGMGREDIYKSLAESVSENLNDAFVAPFLYLLIGGPVLLWIYKAVSTADSMWGYRTEKWSSLGWFGARLDDVLAFVPARISAGLLILGAALLGHDWRNALRHTRTQAALMESPNAGWPMAAAAWCLQAPMGGDFVYFGRLKRKPLLGPSHTDWSQAKIRDLLRLVFIAGLIWALAGQFLVLAVSL
jgi:adenosylcobinamide-phosphate synthase